MSKSVFHGNIKQKMPETEPERLVSEAENNERRSLNCNIVLSLNMIAFKQLN